jgi:hypothetical protein
MRRSVAIGFFAVAFVLGFAAIGFAGGLTKIDGPEPTYSLDVSGGCTVFARLHPQRQSLELRRRSMLHCEPTIEAEMSAIDQLLTAVENDDVKIADLHSGRLGEVVHPAWKERLADCYIAKHGTDISLVVSNAEVLQALKTCQVFGELERVFAKHGAKLTVSSIEKVERISLRRDSEAQWAKAAGLSEAWIAAHRNIRGAVPIWATIFFEISSL